MVSLQHFVRDTLIQVTNGIREAQATPDVGALVAPSNIGGMKFPADSGVYFEARIIATTVKFDVAVTAETKADGKSGVDVSVLSVLSAKLGGEIGSRDMTVSRIQFAVPLVMPSNAHRR